MTSELHTARLLLKPISLQDAEQIQKLFPRWDIVQYLDAVVPWPYPEDGAIHFVREIALPQMARGEAWYWTIRPRTAPEQLIGVISLSRKPDHNRGFWLDPAWQRQGLMTEACEAATDYWFNELQEPVLRSPKAIANEGSRRISEKQGMRVIARYDHQYVGGCLPSELWEISAEEWRARKEQKKSNEVKK